MSVEVIVYTKQGDIFISPHDLYRLIIEFILVIAHILLGTIRRRRCIFFYFIQCLPYI